MCCPQPHGSHSGYCFLVQVLETAAAVRPTCNAAVSGPTAAAAMNTTDSAHSFFMCCPGNGAIVRCLSHVWPGSSNSMASLPPALKPKLQQNIMNSRQGSWHIKHQHSSIAGVAKDVHTSNAEARESPAGSGRMQSTSERSKNPGEHRSVSRTGSSYQPVINGSTEQRHPTREEPEGEPVEVRCGEIVWILLVHLPPCQPQITCQSQSWLQAKWSC